MLENKNILITGCSGGIGHALVECCLDEGARVFAHTRTLTNEWDSNENVIPICFDMRDSKEMKEEINKIRKGYKKIDILINNAGTLSENKLFQMTSKEEMYNVFDVNFFATMELTQLVSRIMNKNGSIVNVASIVAIDGNPAQLEYSASKAAIICATKKLAMEFARMGIRVNAVAPGLTNTNMLNKMNSEEEKKLLDRMVLKRRADPSEIAKAIVFLASDYASYITGQVLRVDGGLLV